MKRMMSVAVAVVGIVVVSLVVACGSQESTTQGQTGSAEITFKSDPETPRTGENTFEVMVLQDGKPVDDANVSVEFFMAAMPQMNMKEMRTTAELKPVGNGTYRGTGQLMMAGGWEVTVMAMRNGQEIGSRKFTMSAQ